MDDRTHARAEDIADQERAIQRDIDAKDKASGDNKPSGAIKAGPWSCAAGPASRVRPAAGRPAPARRRCP